MNILFVTGEYPPLEGGVGAYTAALAASLHQQDVQVTVLTSQQTQGQPTEGMTGITVLPIIQRWDWSIWRIIQLAALTHRVDWVHVQYQTAAYGMNPAINLSPWLWRHLRWKGNALSLTPWLKRKLGLRDNMGLDRNLGLGRNPWHRQGMQRPSFAWTYHDLLIPYLFPKAGDRLRRWVTARPAHTSDRVIVTNEGDRLQLAAQGVTAASIPIGSNITGNMMTSDDRQMRRRKRNFAHDDVVIGYFGFLNRSKGAGTAVRTLHRLVQQRCKAHLLMIGDVAGASDPTNHAYFLEIEQMIIDLGLVDCVRWTGRETDGEVSADLNACDLLLLPYEDGASLRRGTLMAGLANGCAILTTRPQAALPELMEGRDLLYFAPGDDAAAAQLVLQLMRDRSVVAALRSNAFERSKLFTWQTIAARHMQEYQRR